MGYTTPITDNALGLAGHLKWNFMYVVKLEQINLHVHIQTQHYK